MEGRGWAAVTCSLFITFQLKKPQRPLITCPQQGQGVQVVTSFVLPSPALLVHRRDLTWVGGMKREREGCEPSLDGRHWGWGPPLCGLPGPHFPCLSGHWHI